MDGVVPYGMDVTDFPQHFLRDWRSWDVVGNGYTLGGRPFVDGRLELEKRWISGHQLSKGFRQSLQRVSPILANGSILLCTYQLNIYRAFLINLSLRNRMWSDVRPNPSNSTRPIRR
jgi:hypothetical protein